MFKTLSVLVLALVCANLVAAGRELGDAAQSQIGRSNGQGYLGQSNDQDYRGYQSYQGSQGFQNGEYDQVDQSDQRGAQDNQGQRRIRDMFNQRRSDNQEDRQQQQLQGNSNYGQRDETWDQSVRRPTQAPAGRFQDFSGFF